LDLIKALEYPNFEFTDQRIEDYLEKAKTNTILNAGQYARAWEKNGHILMVRDPLGCNKLFYGHNKDGNLVVASRIRRALDLGVHLDNLASCPPGRLIMITKEGELSTYGADISSIKAEESLDLNSFKKNTAEILHKTIKWLNSAFPDKPFAVCLSGGMDSSIVASLAATFLKRVVAVSFSYLSEEDAQVWLEGAEPEKLSSVSEDFLYACEVARALKIPLFPVLRTSGSVLSAAPKAIKLCQDWRDFNVHCAVVNLFLAQDLRALFPSGEVVVLTGDLMNELICDYHEEIIDGTTYYPQPRMSVGNRRRFFVRGLDAGDREIGVFNAYGLPVCQVFSSVAEHYLRIPEEILSLSGVKVNLNSHLLAPVVRDKVNKSKRRAQVGGADGGTLGIFHRLGLTQRKLSDLWIHSLQENLRGENPLDIIQSGRYRISPRA
jgi:asparagine synthetase B (glutamine-hydrolysing)